MEITKFDVAYIYGYNAYDSMNIRGLSADMYKLLEGVPVGLESSALLNAYFGGWDDRATEAANAALLV